jgi:hypothetical protein
MVKLPIVTHGDDGDDGQDERDADDNSYSLAAAFLGTAGGLPSRIFCRLTPASARAPVGGPVSGSFSWPVSG